MFESFKVKGRGDVRGVVVFYRRCFFRLLFVFFWVENELFGFFWGEFRGI